MENLNKAINAAIGKDYLEFEKAVKREMTNRIAKNPYIQKRQEEINRYTNITNAYNAISDK